MAKFILLNSVWIGSNRRFGGDTVDTAVEPAGIVATIQAAGGAVVPASDASAAAAAALAASLRLSGRSVEYIDSVMQATVIAELQTNAVTGQGAFSLSLNDLRIVDANNLVGNAAANGGLLASDTAPPLGGSSKAQRITWATGSVPNVSFQKSVPKDLDPTAPLTLELSVLSGATDAATFTAQAIWDATAAVSYTADDTATKSATLHKITATFLAADIPAAPSQLGVILTPGAHATDAIVLAGMGLFYKRKILTS